MSKREMIFFDSALIAVFCMLVAGSITFLVIADIIVKPISRLTKATNELSKGNYRVRVNYTGKDEIARLNRSFNQMAQQLAKQDETRQQFISDVSHEFQTPLTAIQGFATILKNEKLTDEQRQKYADIILFHSKRLSTLSKNMLQLTLLDGEDVKLEISEFSLIEQLNRVIETQDNFALSKNIEIEFEIPKNDIRIEADESRLEQVWINLINNAIKYTQDNGVVMVHVKKTSKEVEVSIEDTGVGMSKEAISHIFERFYRQDKSRSVEGNGLGLSIVKRIVDLHKGRIDVISREEGGSRFTVHLPQNKSFHISERLIKKELKLSGLVLGESEVIEAMDPFFSISGGSDVIPVSVNKDGTFSKFSSVADSKRFQNIINHSLKTAKTIGEQIQEGYIKPFPYKSGGKKPCSYCPYSALCGFDPTEHKYRYLRNLTKEEVFEKTEKE